MTIVYENHGFRVERFATHLYQVVDSAMQLIAELTIRKDADLLADLCALNEEGLV